MVDKQINIFIMKIIYRIAIILFFILIQANEVLAGPGGKIAKNLFNSPLGKVVGALLFIILFPFILFSWYKRNKSIKAAKGQLEILSKINFELFDEINLKNRITDIFFRVHKAWSEQNVEDCNEFMTDWYSQNQQMVFINDWKRKGLMNVCTVEEIRSIKPIHVKITERSDFEGSRIMYAISAMMEDYLVKIDDSTLLEGHRGFNLVETVWTLKLTNKIWKVDNIEQNDMVSNYIKMESTLPDAILQKLSKN